MTLEEYIHKAEEDAKMTEFDTEWGIGNYFIDRTEALEYAKECRQLAEWLKDYKQLREQTRWILVSERLPEEREWIGTKKFGTTISDEVYVTIETISGYRFCDHIRFQNGKLSMAKQAEVDALYQGAKIIAWMPLPKPYLPDTNIGNMTEIPTSSEKVRKG